MTKINIYSRMSELGHNCNSLAKEVGISWQQMDKIIKGKSTRIYFDTLERICLALHCTPNDIITFE